MIIKKCFQVLLFHHTQQVTRPCYETIHTLHADINVAVYNGICQLISVIYNVKSLTYTFSSLELVLIEM